MAKRTLKDFRWDDMAEVPYRASRLLKALGNPKAYALVHLLLEEDVLNVESMARVLDRSHGAVSKTLRALRDLEVVRYQREGKEVYYTLKDRDAIRTVLTGAEAFARRAASQAKP